MSSSSDATVQFWRNLEPAQTMFEWTWSVYFSFQQQQKCNVTPGHTSCMAYVILVKYNYILVKERSCSIRTSFICQSPCFWQYHSSNAAWKSSDSLPQANPTSPKLVSYPYSRIIFWNIAWCFTGRLGCSTEDGYNSIMVCCEYLDQKDDTSDSVPCILSGWTLQVNLHIVKTKKKHIKFSNQWLC